MTVITPDMETARARVKTIWSSGDFGKIAESIQAHADEFMARLQIFPGMRVLDLACGTGNLAVLAAERGANVTGVDIAPNLIATARERAAKAGLNIEFEEGDVEELPFSDAAFDLVVSMYGVMFAAHPDLAAAELLRVCAPGGKVVLANWTPGGFIGQMLKTVAAFVPPPPGAISPILWGVEGTVKERLAQDASSLQFKTREVVFDYPFGPAQTVDFFIEFYGPTLRAYAACSPEKKPAFRQALIDLWTQHNQVSDGSTYVVSEYLEVTAIRA